MISASWIVVKPFVPLSGLPGTYFIKGDLFVSPLFHLIGPATASLVGTSGIPTQERGGSMKQRNGFRGSLALLGALALAGGPWALEPKDPGSYLDQKAFLKPELSISSSPQPLEEVEHLLPNRKAWQDFQA